jgi:hypothetical protein
MQTENKVVKYSRGSLRPREARKTSRLLEKRKDRAETAKNVDLFAKQAAGK